MGEAMRQFGRRSRDGATPEKAEEDPVPVTPTPADDAGDNEEDERGQAEG
jgi:hypothetical protein